MNRRYFLKKIGKMAVLLASASAFPGLVLSGEASNKISAKDNFSRRSGLKFLYTAPSETKMKNDEEGMWPKSQEFKGHTATVIQYPKELSLEDTNKIDNYLGFN